MTRFRPLAVASLLVGLAMLVWAFGATRSGEPEAVAPLAAFDVPTTAGAVSTPTVVQSEEATPTATPDRSPGRSSGSVSPGSRLMRGSRISA